MKKFEKMYKDYFNDVNLSREEKIKIKEDIVNQKKNKFDFKFAYRFAIFIGVFLVSGVMIVTANSLVRQFKVRENNTVVIENEKLDIDINAAALKKGTYYTHEALENLFGIKILKNSKTSDIYKLCGFDNNGEKVSRVSFDNTDSKGNISIEYMDIGFGFKTKYYDETKEDEMDKLGDMWISGPIDNKEVYYYYIKALDTEAVILSTKGDGAPIIASFVYDNVVYSIGTEKISHTIEDVYSYLDAYTKS